MTNSFKYHSAILIPLTVAVVAVYFMYHRMVTNEHESKPLLTLQERYVSACVMLATPNASSALTPFSETLRSSATSLCHREFMTKVTERVEIAEYETTAVARHLRQERLDAERRAANECMDRLFEQDRLLDRVPSPSVHPDYFQSLRIECVFGKGPGGQGGVSRSDYPRSQAQHQSQSSNNRTQGDSQ